METLHAACNAMATRFEMVLHGPNRVALRSASDAAIREIERLHAQLNLYSLSSEVHWINARASSQAVKLEPGLFFLLLSARRLYQETGGAFDITVAPLIRCWGFMGGSGALPQPAELEEARARVGMDQVILDEKAFTIRFARPGMMIDLGSIGKGYGLDAAAETLLEAGIESALIHGGTSTVYAIGVPPDTEAWRVAIDVPPSVAPSVAGPGSEERQPKRPIAVVALKDESLSVSAVHGKCFQADGKIYGHVIDPRTGAPAQGAALAAVVSASATDSDALSTALLVGGIQDHDRIAALRPSMRTLVAEVQRDTGRLFVDAKGMEVMLASPGAEGRS